MKLNECIEFVQASTGGGVFTDENRNDLGFAENILRLGRAAAIKTLHQNNNLVADIFYQKAFLHRDDLVQTDDCYTVFKTPQILTVNVEVDGNSYLGSPKDNRAWRRVKSVAQFANNQRMRLSGLRENVVYYLLDPRTSTVKVYDPNITQCNHYAIFENPLHPLLNFNRQEDEYPISMEAMMLIEQWMREGIISHMLRQMPETRSNSAPDVTVNLAPNQQ
jgi:hypothetical protein